MGTYWSKFGLFAATVLLSTSSAFAEVLTVDTANDVVDDNDGVMSLREAVALAIDGDVINFDRSLINQPIQINQEPIQIDKSLSIVGLGPSNHRIDGAGKALSAFYITTPSQGFEIQNLGFNGFTRGAIEIQGFGGVSGTIVNCDFENNYSTANGGAIYAVAAGLTIIRSTFHHNSAVSGGAIAIDPARLTLINSDFHDNSASERGGAIAAISEFGGRITTYHTKFETNTAGIGGAIYISNATAELNNSPIKGNTANVGGGLYVNKAGALLKRTPIRDNTAQDSGGGIYSTGAASLIELINSNVVDNVAEKTGGGVRLYVGTRIKLYDSHIVRNVANGIGEDLSQGVGGGIYYFNVMHLEAELYGSSRIANNTPDDCGPVSLCTN